MTARITTPPPVKRPSPTDQVLAEVWEERLAQDDKWGEQNHPDGTGPDLELSDLPVRAGGAWGKDIERWARVRCDKAHAWKRGTFEQILTEEWGEVIAEDDPAKLRVELIQLAAVCAAWVECIDRRTA